MAVAEVGAIKSREVQRAVEAEMRGDADAARRHFLAAAHLEAVLAEDYQNAHLSDLAFRSRLSAASCFWRAGEQAVARQLFDRLASDEPHRAPRSTKLEANWQVN